MLSFAHFTFDSETLELFSNGDPVPLTPKASLVLKRLLSDPGRLVERSELYAVAWEDTVVEFDQSLNSCIRQIRKALNDDVRAPKFIQTQARRGYRFCHPVTTVDKGIIPMSTSRRLPWVGGGLAMGAVLLLLMVLTSRVLNDGRTNTGPVEGIAISDFQVIGFTSPDHDIDQALESSVRKIVARLGLLVDGRTGQRPARFLLTGLVTSTPDGARLHATMLEWTTGDIIWEGTFNPYCPGVKGDPVSIIGHAIANRVRKQILDRGVEV